MAMIKRFEESNSGSVVERLTIQEDRTKVRALSETKRNEAEIGDDPIVEIERREASTKAYFFQSPELVDMTTKDEIRESQPKFHPKPFVEVDGTVQAWETQISNLLTECMNDSTTIDGVTVEIRVTWSLLMCPPPPPEPSREEDKEQNGSSISWV